jgi:hypothetical protein
MKKSTLESLIAEDPPKGRQWRLGQGIIQRTPALREQLQKLYELSKNNAHIGPAYSAKILRRWAEQHYPDLAESVTLGTVKKWWEDKK